MKSVSGRGVTARRGFFAVSFLLFVAMSAGNALAMPTIDGLVQASEYDFAFDVSFTTEDGVTSPTAGQFFVHDDGTNISIGLIGPLDLNDNTYGNTRASDWGTKIHELEDGGGGKSLEGSDKWEIAGWSGSDIKIDYIDEPSWDAIDNNGNLVAAGTSIAYNHDNYPAFFATGPIDSPAMVCPGSATRCTSYDFSATAAGWVPEIMYEFSATRATLGVGALGIGSLAAAQALAADILAASTIHMSPNKLGKNKVFLNPPTPTNPPPPGTAPEPGSIALLGLGLVALALRRRARND